MAVHDSRGRRSYSQRDGTCSGVEHRILLSGQCHHWVEGTRLASRVTHHTHWPVFMDWPDGKRFQVYNDDVSARDDLARNVRGGGGIENYGKRRYVPGEVEMLAAMPVMQGGVDGEADDIPPQVPEQNIDGNQLVLDNGRSDVAPPPGV